jgi:hypothetical protein
MSHIEIIITTHQPTRIMSSPPSTRHTTNTNTTKKLKGKCDICRKTDGFWGHNLQQCQTCGVRVHELCYGMPETNTKDIDFVCHACKAVGVEVEVNVPSIVGGASTTTTAATTNTRLPNHCEWIMQESRPTVCVLCSHDKGIHAMHPLLDVHGPEGRQLTWNGRAEKHDHPPSTTNDDTPPPRPPQLAWVHTLCASVICSNANTAGCVYGCDKNGNFYYDDDYDEEGDDDEEKEDEFDDSFESKEGGGTPTTGDIDTEEDGNCSRRVSINSLKEEDEEETSDLSTRYYAIAAEGVYARTISNHRKLKCYICGRRDDTWRIPLQCSAGDDSEYGPFQERHPRGTEQCTVAVHVGCARWGCVEPEGSHLEMIDGKRCNLCFFTPGRDDDNDDEDYRGSSTKKDGKKEDEAKNDSDGIATEASDTTKTVAHCYCTAHARDIVMNKPRSTRKRKAATDKSSIASCSKHVERMPVFPRERKDRGLTRREMNFANGNISDSRRQLINRVNKF